MVSHSTESHLKWLQWKKWPIEKRHWRSCNSNERRMARRYLAYLLIKFKKFFNLSSFKKMLWSSLGSTFQFGVALFCQLAVLSIAILSTCHFVKLLFDLLPLPFCQLDISSTCCLIYCHFINLPFHQFAISSTWHFINLLFDLLQFHQLAISSTCQFIKLPITQLVVLSTCHFGL